MKKRLVASVLGVVATVATVASSYGQGQVWFDNYNNANPNGVGGYSSPITFSADPAQAPTGMAGLGIPASLNFVASLQYVIGSATDPNPLANVPIGDSALTRPFSNVAGTISPAIATIPGYSSGPVSLQVYVTGSANGVDYWGKSAVLELPSIATGTTLPGYLDGLQSFNVVPVPEPTTLALAGLGAAALLMYRRRSN